MQITSTLVTLMAATGVVSFMPPDVAASAAYPLCPEGYTTSCCSLVFPYSNSCRRGKCRAGYGWSCLNGPGKVGSIRECLEDYEDRTAYCKKPGEQNFPSVLSWEGSAFKALIEPADYRQWVRPGMEKPWTPSDSEIRWEDQVDVESKDSAEGSELKKREAEPSDVDLE
ncbi:uncharacterized protein F5Z01DRAFT_642081 [Emericellopsis atlantica]|uniref:Uncharacterized protein n=1 Tax=Emericellopsis atlantica TaxID=2614577 RepID=A0A9P7ZVD3_9HYPO|nr:uncharacterized protein F5Z01DRAFT_642081 [Emericellopsis atlantica]KAG9259029.1 hypothetical protein F5Z01DRAFT_642081 [Emericellopsis atlantica]